MFERGGFHSLDDEEGGTHGLSYLGWFCHAPYEKQILRFLEEARFPINLVEVKSGVSNDRRRDSGNSPVIYQVPLRTFRGTSLTADSWMSR